MVDVIDLEKFDDRFDNRPVKIGSHQSEMDDKRDQFIEENIDKIELEPVYPKNIQGNS